MTAAVDAISPTPTLADAAADLVQRTRAAQGLPAQVENPTILARVARAIAQ